jgi:hypothetical protein
MDAEQDVVERRIRMTRAESERLDYAAKSVGVSPSCFVRDCLLPALRFAIPKVPDLRPIESRIHARLAAGERTGKKSE